MNELNVIIATLAAMSVVALAWLGGYRLGLVNGTNAERAFSDRRIQGVLAQENARKPKSQKAKRKQARRATLTRIGSIRLP
jgi:hypothetical protein